MARAKRMPADMRSIGQLMHEDDERAARRAVGFSSDLFFTGHDLIIHEFPVLDMYPEHHASEWHASGYQGEESYLFGPDDHPWYLSLEHALLVEREKVTVLTRVLDEPADTEPEPVRLLVGHGFAGTWVWPVFRHWLGL